MSSLYDFPVHPAAAVFPMLPNDELIELANDIEDNGLRQAIVIQNGLLIDGRNRLEACRQADMVPRFEELAANVDPIAYILSANINRRHLSKGQRAMAVAKLYPDPTPRGGGRDREKQSLIIKDSKTNEGYVSQARTVIHWSPPLADRVLAGEKPLAQAYEDAIRLKNQSDSEPARLDRLRQAAKDLADAVIEDKQSLLEAEAELGRRLMDRRNIFTACRALFEKLTGLADLLNNSGMQQMTDALTDAESPLQKDKAITLIDAWIEKFTELKERIQ